MSKTRKQLVKIILTAVLIAMNILLERLPAFKSVSNHMSLSIITTGFSAVYLGIPYTVALTTLGDLLGALILPFGDYNPFFTLTNAVSGLIVALFLSKRATMPRICIGVAVNKIVCTLLLNSLLIACYYSGGIFAFPAVMVGRIPQTLIMTATEIAVLLVLYWKKSRVRKILDKVVVLR